MAVSSSRARHWVGSLRVPGAARVAALVAGVIALGLSASWLTGRWLPFGRDAGRDLDPLAAAVRGWTARPVEGRLCGGFDYAPFAPAAAKKTLSVLTPEGQRLFDAGRKIVRGPERGVVRGPEREVPPGGSPAKLEARGRLLLLWGQSSEAVQALEDVRFGGRDDGHTLSDLAVAYLARAAETGDAGDFARALDVSEVALAREPDLPEARFNRALALDALSLEDAAAQAWERYLEVDPDSGWAGEARARLDALQTARPPAAAPRDDGLPEAASGDPRERAARGRLEAGITLYQQFRLQEAATALSAVRSALAAVASPLTPWADYYLALCRYQEADYDGALEGIGRVLDAPAAPADDAVRRNDVLGRSLQLAGLIHNIEGRFGEGLAAYRQAVDKLGTGSSHSAWVVVQRSLAQSYERLGDRRTAWRHRYAALAKAGALDASGRVRVYSEPAAAVLRAGLPHAARYFATATVLAAEEAGRPAFSVAAYRRRAAVWQALDAPDRALADLDRALRESAAIPDPTVAQITRADILLTRGDLEADRSADDALTDVSEALAIYRATDNRNGEPQALRRKARVERELGDLAAARGDLDRALALLEEQHRGVDGIELRGTFFRASRPVYGEMAEVALDHGELFGALAVAERSHEVGGLDLWAGRSGPGARRRHPSLEQVRTKLGPDTVLLEYFVLPDRLLVGLIRQEGVWVRQVPVGASDLGRLVQAFRRHLVRGADPDAVHEAGARLYERLVAPVRDHLRAGDDLVVIPDGPLHGVPFAALWDTEHGRYLLEDHQVLSSPSAAYAVAGRSGQSGRTKPSIQDSSKILVVADPAPDPAFPGLPALPGARQEAEAIQSLFPGTTVLSGTDASAARFLEEAPGHAVIHFGGHAIANPDSPLLSFLALAPGTGPGTGALFAKDLAGAWSGRRLDGTRLVVLAACRSGDIGGPDGSAGLSSLSRAFLATGVPLVIGSLWNAEDTATARLFELFYRELQRGLPAPAALRAAQLALSSDEDGNTHSSFAWAAFRAEGSIIRSSYEGESDAR